MDDADPQSPIQWRRGGVWLGRGLLALLPFVFCAYMVLPWWVDSFAGASQWSVLDPKPLSSATQAFLDRQLAELKGRTLLDVHAHLAGRGQGSDSWVHPDMRSRWHPFAWVRFQAYLSAGRVGPKDDDTVFAAGLVALQKALPLPVEVHLLGFDFAYDGAGKRAELGSAFFVSDSWVYAQAALAGPGFLPAPSIHPRDPRAKERLLLAAQRGARLIKWLPAAHNIDPGDPALADFYEAVKALDLTLLVHCGDENAVETGPTAGLGNPLRLRTPLGLGVRVVVAHCATTGLGEDLDHPGSAPVPNHQLFLRLMDEERFEGLLFGEISTLTQSNHWEHGLRELLNRRDLHGRLVNGSDWPLPAVHILYPLTPLVRAGLVDPDERAPLSELYQSNPLLFDLALKRCVRDPETGARFAAELFVKRAEVAFLSEPVSQGGARD